MSPVQSTGEFSVVNSIFEQPESELSAVPLLLLPRSRRLPRLPPKWMSSTVVLNRVQSPPSTEYSKYSFAPNEDVKSFGIENLNVCSLSAVKVT